LLQIPIPAHLSKQLIIDAITPEKDVDGLTSINAARLVEGNPLFTPATARGIVEMLDAYKIEIAGKHIVVIGRSNLVGKPTALALLNRDATVTIAHLHTKQLETITKQADIVVVAIGDPEFITSKYVRKDQIVIDVGITVREEGKTKKVVGDVAFQDVKDVVKGISPVPGGVGPMTVTALFQNLIDAVKFQNTTLE
jgi:methylenetetrahydrofolate dehydrogenase (NADP+)/methenyltetrahydrofolate cyclohydrolase